MNHGGDEPIFEETLKVVAAMCVIDPQILSPSSHIHLQKLIPCRSQAAVFHVSDSGIGLAPARS